MLLLCDINTELQAEVFATVVINKGLEEVVSDPPGPMTLTQKVAGLLFLWKVTGRSGTDRDTDLIRGHMAN